MKNLIDGRVLSNQVRMARISSLPVLFLVCSHSGLLKVRIPDQIQVVPVHKAAPAIDATRILLDYGWSGPIAVADLGDPGPAIVGLSNNGSRIEILRSEDELLRFAGLSFGSSRGGSDQSATEGSSNAPDDGSAVEGEALNDQLTTEDVFKRGMEVYKSIQSLTRADDGRTIAIHISSRDWVIESTSGQALRSIRKLHPGGQLFVRTLGESQDYGLAIRMGTRPMPGVKP